MWRVACFTNLIVRSSHQVFCKKDDENMPQIYRTPMPKGDFNKVALQSELMSLKHQNIKAAQTLLIPEHILLSLF